MNLSELLPINSNSHLLQMFRHFLRLLNEPINVSPPIRVSKTPLDLYAKIHLEKNCRPTTLKLEGDAMADVLKTIQQRQSMRVTFDPNRPVSKENLRQILEAARWAPTAHNMQNFEVLLVDDKEVLEKIGNIRSRVSETFIRENYEQLAFSEEELLQKKVGILGTNFPPDWRDPVQLDKAVRESAPSPLNQRIRGSPALLIVIYDSRKRAPASEGDVLGFISLGCVMENMWLAANSLGISVHILSVFSGDAVEKAVKHILKVPKYMKIAFAIRLGYPVSKQSRNLRVRRDMEMFIHHNQFGNKGPA